MRSTIQTKRYDSVAKYVDLVVVVDDGSKDKTSEMVNNKKAVVLRHLKAIEKKQMSSSFSIMWCFSWCAVLFVIYYPGFLSGIVSMLGIGRGVDLAIYVSVICLFYLVYKLFIKIQPLERRITLLVRKLAVKKIKGAK